MIELKWTRALDRSHWVANLGPYKCSITPPESWMPLPMYNWEVNGAMLGGRGGASHLAICKKAVAEFIEKSESKHPLLVEASRDLPTRKRAALDAINQFVADELD